MAEILFDCALLSTPYRLKRCTHQLLHLALIADRLGHRVRILTTQEHLAQHSFLQRHEHLLTFHRDLKPDIYVAKSDAFYLDQNWNEIVGPMEAFKVCLCNSDRCFRESSRPYRGVCGKAVQTRCDLYMPVNHSSSLLLNTPGNVIPAAHPINPIMCRMLRRMGLYERYLDDDIYTIRGAFPIEETSQLGFMGSRLPEAHRSSISGQFPSWVDFRWARKQHPKEFVTWMLRRRGCLDLRGHGDKSLRFTEAVLFGRTIVTSPRTSTFDPPLEHGVNGVIFENANELTYDHDLWLSISERATIDYCLGWSMRAQMKRIIEAAGA